MRTLIYFAVVTALIATIAFAAEPASNNSRSNEIVVCGTEVETGEPACGFIEMPIKDDIDWPQCYPGGDYWVLVPYTIFLPDFPWFETGWKWVLIHIDPVPCPS